MPTTSGRACGCGWWTSWPSSVTRPRCPAGWPPPPGGNAAGCVRAARKREVLGYAQDVAEIPDAHPEEAEAEVLMAERNAALREAFHQLPPRCQELIGLLLADPPVTYAEISDKLGIPIGSIGPTRSRCLDRLRRYPAVAALIMPEPVPPEVG